MSAGAVAVCADADDRDSGIDGAVDGTLEFLAVIAVDDDAVRPGLNGEIHEFGDGVTGIQVLSGEFEVIAFFSASLRA